MILLFYFTIFVFSINWETLTKEEVAALTPEEISAASSSETSKIPAESCEGFTSTQFLQVKPTTYQTPCSGFTSDCFSYMTDDSFSGFRIECIKQFNKDNVGVWKKSQVAAMDSSQWGGILQQILKKFSDDACSGIQADQMRNLDTSYYVKACKGFTASCLGSVQPESMSGISNECVNQLIATQVSEITGDQVKNIPKNSFSGIYSTTLAGFNDDACTGIQTDQMESLNNDYNFKACSGFTASCLENVPAESYKGVTSECISRLIGSQLGKISSEQIKNIPANSFESFYSSAIKGFDSKSCDGFQSDQFAKLNNDYLHKSCNGFSEDCIANFDPKQVGGIDSECISHFSASSVAGFTTDAFRNLTPKSLIGFDSSQVGYLVNQCDGFTKNQVGYLNNDYTKKACNGFKPECIEKIPAESFQGFKEDCFNKLSDNAFSLIKKEQVENFSGGAVSGLISSTISLMNLDGCKGITTTFMENLNNDYIHKSCKGFQQDCIHNIPEESFSTLQSSCSENLKNDALVKITKDQVSKFSLDGTSGLTEMVIKNINVEACSGWKSNQLGSLNVDFYHQACKYFPSKCMKNIKTDSMDGFKGECINQMQDYVFNETTGAQALALSDDGISGITKNTLSHFSTDICKNLNKHFISTLNQDFYHQACGGFEKYCIELVQIDSCPGFNKECVENVIDYNIIYFNEEQITSFTSNGISGLSAQKWYNLVKTKTHEFVDKFVLEQFKEVNPSIFETYKSCYYPNAKHKILLEAFHDFEVSKIEEYSMLQYSTIIAEQMKSLTSSQFILLYDSSYYGLRKDQISIMSDNILEKIDCKIIGKLLSDTVDGISAKQISYIDSDLFLLSECENIPYFFTYINNFTIQGLTKVQIDNSVTYLKNYLVCEQWFGMLEEQHTWIKEKDSSVYEYFDGKCNHPDVCDPPCKHGTCVNQYCNCFNGWTNIFHVDCSEYYCQTDCGENATCVGPNECKCKSGYSGEYPICIKKKGGSAAGIVAAVVGSVAVVCGFAFCFIIVIVLILVALVFVKSTQSNGPLKGGYETIQTV